MKKYMAISLLAVSFAGAAFAQQSVPAPSAVEDGSPSKLVKFYGEAAALWVPSNNGLDDSFGATLSGGVLLRDHHILTTDVSWFEADYENGGGSIEFIPVTLSYQYALPLGKNFQGRAGVLAGAMFEKSDSQPGISNSSRTAFTYGASVGLDYAFTENVSAGISGKWMHVDEVEDLRERDMALVGLTFSVKF